MSVQLANPAAIPAFSRYSTLSPRSKAAAAVDSSDKSSKLQEEKGKTLNPSYLASLQWSYLSLALSVSHSNLSS
jgi:hypothetical protein